MKILSCLPLLLWVSASQADISLSLGNKQYLPPPIQELPVEGNNTQLRQKIEEKKYGNSRYQIFEVHNHHEPKFKGEENNYSGLQKKFAKEIRIEHINAPKGFPLDDPDLNASYLRIAAGNDESNKQIIVKHEIKTNNLVPFSSNYRHALPENSDKKKNFGDVQQSYSSVNKFMGPDYLPPKSQTQEYLTNPVQNSFAKQVHETSQQFKHKRSEDRFKGPGYLPPQQHVSLNLQHNTAFKGPGYLPPLQFGNFGSSHPHENLGQSFGVHNNLQSHQQTSIQSDQQVVTKTQFKGSDYLPPPFKGPEYLPPHESQEAFKGPEYLPPKENNVVQHLQQSLPPGYDFEKPSNAEAAIEELHKLPEESIDSQAQFNGHMRSSNINRYTPDLSDTKGVLQSKQDFQKLKDSEQAINLLRNEAITTNIEPYKVSKYSLPVYHFQKTLSQLNQQSQFESHQNSQHLKQQQLPVPKALNSLQQFKAPDYLPPTTTSQTYSEPQTLNGRNYLPSTTGSQNSKGPLPPANSEQTDAYFPSTTPTNNHILYPLSNYMSSVKPYDRYGNRRPFPEYGLPPPQSTTFFSSNDLSPMYRNPASRPQFYAPTMMHYINKDYNSRTSATLATTEPSNAKIRTVQIFNPTAVKTLKVLESLDNAGVKTIKILGPSHEQPMGDHHVVKVVSGSREQSVQTVKIFDDDQPVTLNTNGASTVEESNSYLPPRGKRNSNNKTKT